MRGLTSSDLLILRDRCRDMSAPDAAVQMLGLADPAAVPAVLAELTVGQLDRHLLLLRAATVGQRMELCTDCPACGEALELTHDLADLLVDDPDPAEVAALPPLEVDGRPMHVRPATLADLVEAAAAIDVDAARRIIAARCLTPADGAEPSVAADLPEPIPDSVAERLAALDPQADLELGLECPACRHAWQTPLDVMGTVRRELDLRAAHVLAEVHELALAYHWSEAEILALSASRRQDYLALIPRMSDYLTRLARTALGWTQPLQPRVPFRFEPLSPTKPYPDATAAAAPSAPAPSDSAAASANQPREERRSRSVPPGPVETADEPPELRGDRSAAPVAALTAGIGEVMVAGLLPEAVDDAAPRRATATPAPSIADGSRRPSPAPSEPWPRAAQPPLSEPLPRPGAAAVESRRRAAAPAEAAPAAARTGPAPGSARRAASDASESPPTAPMAPATTPLHSDRAARLEASIAPAAMPQIHATPGVSPGVMRRDAETAPRAPAPSPESGDAPARPSVERQHSDPPSMPRPARPPSPGRSVPTGPAPMSGARLGPREAAPHGDSSAPPEDGRPALRGPIQAAADAPTAPWPLMPAPPSPSASLRPAAGPPVLHPGARRSRDAGDPASQVQIEIGQIEVVVRRPESADSDQSANLRARRPQPPPLAAVLRRPNRGQS